MGVVKAEKVACTQYMAFGKLGRSFGRAIRGVSKTAHAVAKIGGKAIEAGRTVQKGVQALDRATGGFLDGVPVLGAGVAALREGGAADRLLDAGDRARYVAGTVANVTRVAGGAPPPPRRGPAPAVQQRVEADADQMDVAPRAPSRPLRTAPPAPLAPPPERSTLADQIRGGVRLRPTAQGAALLAPPRGPPPLPPPRPAAPAAPAARGGQGGLNDEIRRGVTLRKAPGREDMVAPGMRATMGGLGGALSDALAKRRKVIEEPDEEEVEDTDAANEWE